MTSKEQRITARRKELFERGNMELGKGRMEGLNAVGRVEAREYNALADEYARLTRNRKFNPK